MERYIIFLSLLAMVSAFSLDLPVCPDPVEGEPAVLFPNPINCAQFYICQGLNLTLHTCDSGLWFNPNNSVCDYPENIEEGICIPPGFESTVSPNGCYEVSQILPNPNNCATFFICNEDLQTEIMECDDGLWFNPLEMGCDYPHNVPPGVCIPPPEATTLY